MRVTGKGRSLGRGLPGQRAQRLERILKTANALAGCGCRQLDSVGIVNALRATSCGRDRSGG